MIDPRSSVVNERLKKIKRIIAISSGKGGVGKSMVATALALSLSRDGYNVGLFDLDFTGPSTHIILNVPKNLRPLEDKGLVPPKVENLNYMSLVYFVGDNPVPLRGLDISNALLELLTVTQWGELDFLIIDMPPGISDAVLDVVRFIKRIEFLIITTSSLLAFEVVKKQVTLLLDMRLPIIGVVENMKMDKINTIEREVSKLKLRYLCPILFDAKVESSISYPSRLLRTSLGTAMKQIKDYILLAGNKMSYKAIIFDYIGTLVNCKGYRLDASRKTLYNALVNQGFDMPEDRFMAAYDSAHLKYRKIRYEQFKEVTNAVWVSEALSNFYNKIAPDDSRIKEALNMFFQEFVNTFELRSGAKELLQQTAGKVKVCLISNFTYAPVIHSSLRKIGIDQYFNLIVISDDIGWRKPSPKIFQYALNRLQVKACEAIFIGDSPIEDIEGAQNSGLKAIFVPSQFNSLKDLENCKQKPNYTTKDLNTLINDLNRFLTQTN